jgi:hypothetical protein
MKHFAGAARLFTGSFRTAAKLAEDMRAQYRYDAACAAALAGAGQGADQPPPDEPAKARWRRQARDWLRADLAHWTQQAETGQPEARALVGRTLQHWRVDPDLAGIRDLAALAKLPEPERMDCQALWAAVDAVLRQAGAGRPAR